MDGGYITVIATRCTAAAIPKNVDSYVYADKTAAHFGDLEHLITCCKTANSSTGIVVVWSISNTVDDYYACGGANDLLWCKFYSSTTMNIGCENTNNSDSYTLTQGTVYYCTIKRAGTTLTNKIYSDSARTVLLDTLSIVCENGTKRYIYGMQSANLPAVQTISGYSENLDLQEAAPSAKTVSFPNYYSCKFVNTPT